MDAIRSNMTAGMNSVLQPEIKAAKKPVTSHFPEDCFNKTPPIEVPIKPVIREQSDKSAIGLIGSSNPITEGAISSSAPGSPIFNSIAGSIAKWLISTQDEIKLGQMITKKIEKEMPISDDPVLNARVTNIGNKIAAISTRKDVPYQFKVINDDTVNAFACPGGFIYVHKGLLDQFPDDKHLTFILGHEVGHVENRDSIDALGVNFVLQIIQTALGKTPGKLDDLLGAAVGKVYASHLSQKAEFKADMVGAQRMEQLGINPKYGAEALRGLEKGRNTNPSIFERLLSTHPPIEERARRLEAYAAK